jgi:hypothetical protein
LPPPGIAFIVIILVILEAASALDATAIILMTMFFCHDFSEGF